MVCDRELTESVIVFDGLCNLCAGVVRFVIGRDRRRAFRFAPMQGETGARLMRAHGLDPRDVKTFLLLEDGQAFLRSEAVLRIVRRLPFPWNCLVVFRVLPRAVRDRIYDFIAARRYRWFGKRQACLTPECGLEDRFLR